MLYTSFVVLWFMWLFALQDWLGWVFGTILAIIVAPAVFIFPIVYWLVEDGVAHHLPDRPRDRHGGRGCDDDA